MNLQVQTEDSRKTAFTEFTENVIAKMSSWTPAEQISFIEQVKMSTYKNFLNSAEEYAASASELKNYADELKSV